MKRTIGVLAAVLALTIGGGLAQACHCHGKKGPNAAKTSAREGPSKGGCGSHGSATTADKKPCSKKCHKETATLVNADAGEKEGCPVEKKVQAVLASMPSMKYRVGSETMCCAKSAGAMAKSSGKPMRYVVEDEVFDSEGEATAKLASLLEAEVEAMATLHFATAGETYHCPMAAKEKAKKAHDKVVYRVGGVDFVDKDRAEEAVKLVSEKLSEVKMSYKVGDKSFCCDKMAGSETERSGKKVLYVVDGEETPCPKTARVNLARAKIRKIVETVASL